MIGEVNKYNVYFRLRGPAGEIEVPNSTNPVVCANLASLLAAISQNLPGGWVETIGIRIAKCEGEGSE